MKLLIDADMLLWSITSATEVEVLVEEDTWTRWSDLTEARDKMQDELQLMHDEFGTNDDDIIFCLSHAQLWRKEIYPEYKANRKGKPKPIGFRALRDELKQKHFEEWPSLEADDVMGLLATSPVYKGECVIVSGDKDLNQIPGTHYWQGERWEVNEERARFQFYFQALAGDTTDNIPGCPTIGPKRAATSLEGLSTDLDYWERIVQEYEKRSPSDHGKENALLNARLVRIVRDNEYDWVNRQVIPWTPPNLPLPS